MVFLGGTITVGGYHEKRQKRSMHFVNDVQGVEVVVRLFDASGVVGL